MNLKKTLLPLTASLILNTACANNQPDINKHKEIQTKKKQVNNNEKLIVSVPIWIQLNNSYHEIRKILMGTPEENIEKVCNSLIKNIKSEFFNEKTDEELKSMNYKELANYLKYLSNKYSECTEKKRLVDTLWYHDLELNWDNIWHGYNPTEAYNEINKEVFGYLKKYTNKNWLVSTNPCELY